MNNIENYQAILKNRLSDKRYKHCLNVCKKAKELAHIYGVDENKAALAGLLHDITKEIPTEEHLKIFEKKENINLDEICIKSPKLWHAKSGAIYVESELLICDVDILNAISYHTTGRENMSLLEKIIYVSDAISEERTYEGVDNIRQAANTNLDLAMVLLLSLTINKLLNMRKAVCVDTIKAYNELVEKI